MPGNRNILFLIIGALIVAVAVLGYNLYQDQEATGGPADQCRPERAEDPEQVRPDAPPIMKASRIEFLSILLLGALGAVRAGASATAQQVAREQDIVNLRLGQRIKVDDGTCPAGQIKEVSGTKMTANGVDPHEQMRSAGGTAKTKRGALKIRIAGAHQRAVVDRQIRARPRRARAPTTLCRRWRFSRQP